MAFRVISDFDQTLINLEINWNSFRNEYDLNRVADIWKMGKQRQQKALKALCQLEIQAAGKSDIHSCCKSILSNKLIGVLTNNSETAVNLLFEKLSRELDVDLTGTKVVGRETLGGPKENKQLFSQGIHLILSHAKLEETDDLLYVGDSEYEIKYAQEIGLKTRRILPNQIELFS